MAITAAFLEEIHGLLSLDQILTTQTESYGRDETEEWVFVPEVVVFPDNAPAVAAVLGCCQRHGVPVTCRGGGTGLSGGALPVQGGLVLSTARLNRILQIDTDNLQVTVEPGVITQVMQEAVREHGLYYPPDPSSRGTCTIGGNLAESAGGPHAFKYGTTKDYVLNLEVALMDGTLLWTGASVSKYATGYHLTQLMVGSEGTLGVITKAVFRLIPAPKADLLLSVPFPDLESACRAVAAIQATGIRPSAVEFMEKEALQLSASYLGMEVPYPSTVQAELLIELDGERMDLLMEQAEILCPVLEEHGAGEIRLADQSDRKEALWTLRRFGPIRCTKKKIPWFPCRPCRLWSAKSNPWGRPTGFVRFVTAMPGMGTCISISSRNKFPRRFGPRRFPRPFGSFLPLFVNKGGLYPVNTGLVGPRSPTYPWS